MNQVENIYNKKTLDLIEDLVFIKDTKGIYLFVNKAFSKFANIKRKHIIGKSDYDLFNKEDAKAFRKNDELTIKAKKESIYYESLTLDSNDVIYFKSTKNVLLDDEKNIVATIGTARNITKQKEYEILYETNQEILEKIIEDASLEETCNFIIEKVESLNTNMICSILLLDKKEQRFTVGFAPSLTQEYNDAIKTLVIGKDVGSCGTAAFTKQRVIVENIDEHPYWSDYLVLTKPLKLHACWSQPFFSKEKEVLGTFAIYYNKAKAPTNFELKLIDSFSHLVSLAVNKRNDLEKIKEKENFLVQQSKLVSIGDMLESISHHWRQPLSVISTIASGLRLEKHLHSKEEDAQDDALNKIIETTKKLSNTIDQFRNYFIKNHPKEHFFIRSTVDKTLAILDGKFNESNIEFILDIEDLNLNSYENEFIHIFLNLFNNAKDAFELKEIEKRYIFVDIKKENEICVIKIKDNAGGINQEIIDRVFEPYFTTKNKAQGIGIGLFTIQDILTRHLKGSIQVQNEKYTYQNQDFMGASFTITIPID